MLEKKELRKLIRQQKTAHTVAALAEMSTHICHRVCSSAFWHQTSTVLLYHPLPDEVDVRPLLQLALDEGKQVLLPVVVGDELELRRYTDPSQLALGAYGILEPTGPLFERADYGQIDLAIIPGMAFDDVGHRLGRGRGYYDRLLPLLIYAHRVGVCFPFQRADFVPAEKHDVMMHEIVS